MSLKVWLPLNGNTNNYGTLHQLDSIKVCKEPKYNTDIGGGIEFTGNTNNLLLFPEKELYLAYTDNFTISGWFYNTNLNTEGSSRDYSFTIGRVDVGEGGIGARFSNKQFLVYYNKIVFAIPTEYEEWNNFTFTKHGTTGYYYKNGVLIGTKVLNSDPAWSAGNQGYCGLGLGCFYYGSYTAIYPWKGKIKDFRIYDEVLSEQQIKDLSRGLFVHYKLNQPERSENLLTNTYNKIASFASDSTIENAFYGTPAIHRYRTGITEATWSEAQFYVYTCKPNTNYTFSVWMKASKSEDIPFKNFGYRYSVDNNSWINGDIILQKYPEFIANTWQKYITIIITPSCDILRFWLYNIAAYNFDYYIARPKIEEGYNENPQWTPSPKDSITWDNTEYDGSGFCNHGQLIGSVTSDFTTPRYDLAYSFNNSGYIKNDNFNCTVDKCTINFWVKPRTITKQHFIFSTHKEWTKNGISMWVNSGANTAAIMYAGVGEFSISWNIDVWQMITLVTDTKKIYVYNNGSLQISKDFAYSKIENPVLYIGSSLYGDINSERAECSLSDFRFYTSALSADDIKEIYNYRK